MLAVLVPARNDPERVRNTAMDALANERIVRGEGATAEAVWQDWLERLAPPRLQPGQLLGPAERLVVVSPHPDDEILGCGGLLAWHARRGGVIEVVAVTDGEASHRADPSWPPGRLGAVRRVERERGLMRLGVTWPSVTRLGLPDGDVAAYRQLLVCALRALLREGDVVVATWSLDGHPDHDVTGASVERVCAERGCRLMLAPVWMWHWSVPGDPRVPWQRLGAVPLSADVLARKALALGEHRTQLQPRIAGAGAVLSASILARAGRASEYYFV
jgi:LmbE family N-acetylglucosaminyl deacetylase